jgi:hypothetical protein
MSSRLGLDGYNRRPQLNRFADSNGRGEANFVQPVVDSSPAELERVELR